jgi:hypothetical protein
MLSRFEFLQTKLIKWPAAGIILKEPYGSKTAEQYGTGIANNASQKSAAGGAEGSEGGGSVNPDSTIHAPGHFLILHGPRPGGKLNGKL